MQEPKSPLIRENPRKQISKSWHILRAKTRRQDFDAQPHIHQKMPIHSSGCPSCSSAADNIQTIEQINVNHKYPMIEDIPKVTQQLYLICGILSEISDSLASFFLKVNVGLDPGLRKGVWRGREKVNGKHWSGWPCEFCTG